MEFCVKSFILIYISIVNNVLTENTTELPERTNSKLFDESIEDLTTETTTLFIATETDENVVSSVHIVKDDLKNNTDDEFKPSVHLGEIEEPRMKYNPFNNVHHVRFENSLNVGSQQDNLQNVKQRIMYDLKEHENDHVKFEDDKQNLNTRKYQQFLSNLETIQPLEMTVTQSSRSHLENFGEQKVISDHTFLQNLEKPVYVEEHTSMIFEKPMRFPNELNEHLPISNSNLDDQNMFYFVPDYRFVPNHQNNYYNVEQQEQTYGNVQKPNNNINNNNNNNNMMVYLTQQHEYTTLRKPAHYYYHQPVGYHEMAFLGEPRPTQLYPKGHRISPWKKIIHLIGAFLPFGLLLAALAPNVVKIQNTTEPNIVLSKLRVVDLPIEHKQARTLDERQGNVCEERSICELILAGGKPRTNIVQNVLWNLAIRSSDEMAKNVGLEEIFEAVKKKNCATIIC